MTWKWTVLLIFEPINTPLCIVYRTFCEVCRWVAWVLVLSWKKKWFFKNLSKLFLLTALRRLYMVLGIQSPESTPHMGAKVLVMQHSLSPSLFSSQVFFLEAPKFSITFGLIVDIFFPCQKNIMCNENFGIIQGHVASYLSNKRGHFATVAFSSWTRRHVQAGELRGVRILFLEESQIQSYLGCCFFKSISITFFFP